MSYDFKTAMREGWESFERLARADGEDPDELLRSVADNLRRWGAGPRGNYPGFPDSSKGER